MASDLIKDKSGLYVPAGDFYLDPKRKSARAVISHAHSDHAIASNAEVWCTPETRSIMIARYGDKLRSRFHVVSYFSEFSIGDVKLHFVPAGHILGSAQVIMDISDHRYCYTGDYKVRPDESCHAFKAVQCDTLITETTFANPETIHPEEHLEISKLGAYRDYNIVIGAYIVGKAQRLNRLINKFMPDREVMVHPEAAVFHRVYEDHGMNPGTWQPYNYQKFRRDKGLILLVPPRALSTFRYTPGVMTTFATGWNNHPIASQFRFHISDHADWHETLWLIENARPKRVFTVHGDGAPLKDHLRKVKPEITVASLS